MIIEEISLHFFGGGSDKVYHAQIETVPASPLYVVNCQYGRRGSALTAITKTPQPVDLRAAQKVYQKIVGEKQNKGYQITNSATPVRQTPSTANFGQSPVAAPEFEPQLLNAVDESALSELFRNPHIGAQEKYDGCRLVVIKKDGNLTGLNRRGLRVGIPQAIADDIQKLKASEITLDGEIVGETFYVFDCVSIEGRDLKTECFRNRAIELSRAVSSTVNLVRAPLEVTEFGKRALYERLKTGGREGIVFKDLQAPYTAGRPNSGGGALKFKFCDEATCIVKEINQTKRSVAIQVKNNDGSLRDIGNCTIPPNFPIPTVGAFVEIRYLYAYPEGSLYQPVYKGERADKSEADLYESLKFKSATDNLAAA